MLRRPFIATALAIIALIIVLLLVSLAQEHKHLRSVQEELGRTNQQVVKLEKVIGSLKADLDTAQSQLKEKEVLRKKPIRGSSKPSPTRQQRNSLKAKSELPI
jgi:peptidoglycan hydrolase CwlO-like protein